jgi:hypothetical protein
MRPWSANLMQVSYQLLRCKWMYKLLRSSFEQCAYSGQLWMLLFSESNSDFVVLVPILNTTLCFWFLFWFLNIVLSKWCVGDYHSFVPVVLLVLDSWGCVQSSNSFRYQSRGQMIFSKSGNFTEIVLACRNTDCSSMCSRSLAWDGIEQTQVRHWGS